MNPLVFCTRCYHELCKKTNTAFGCCWKRDVVITISLPLCFIFKAFSFYIIKEFHIINLPTKKRIAHNKFISVSMACILCKMAYGRFWSFFPSLYRIIGVMHKLLIFLYCRHGCYVSLSFLKNICICFLLIPGMAYMIAWVSGAWDLLDVFEHFSKSFRLMLQVWEVSCLLWWWRRREES